MNTFHVLERQMLALERRFLKLKKAPKADFPFRLNYFSLERMSMKGNQSVMFKASHPARDNFCLIKLNEFLFISQLCDNCVISFKEKLWNCFIEASIVVRSFEWGLNFLLSFEEKVFPFRQISEAQKMLTNLLGWDYINYDNLNVYSQIPFVRRSLTVNESSSAWKKGRKLFQFLYLFKG